MKDYSRILESAGRDNLQEMVQFRPGQDVSEWNALKLIEEMSEKMRNRLYGVMDPQWKQEVSHVKLDLYDPPKTGLRLLLKAQIYRLSNKELLLKVFAHHMDGRGQTSKMARASYHIQIVHENNRGMVA